MDDASSPVSRSVVPSAGWWANWRRQQTTYANNNRQYENTCQTSNAASIKTVQIRWKLTNIINFHSMVVFPSFVRSSDGCDVWSGVLNPPLDGSLFLSPSGCVRITCRYHVDPFRSQALWRKWIKNAEQILCGKMVHDPPCRISSVEGKGERGREMENNIFHKDVYFSIFHFSGAEWLHCHYYHLWPTASWWQRRVVCLAHKVVEICARAGPFTQKNNHLKFNNSIKCHLA